MFGSCFFILLEIYVYFLCLDHVSSFQHSNEGSERAGKGRKGPERAGKGGRKKQRDREDPVLVESCTGEDDLMLRCERWHLQTKRQ